MGCDVKRSREFARKEVEFGNMRNNKVRFERCETK